LSDERVQARAVLPPAVARELVAALSGEPTEDRVATLLADYCATRAILDGAGAGIGVLDPELRYIYVNEALAELNGLPAATHFGRSVRDLLPDLDLEPMEATLRTVLKTGEPQLFTVSGRTPADPAAESRWWVNAYHRLDDPAGAVLGVVGVVLEVTETYRVRQLLDRARTRLALLDEAATRIGTTLDVGYTGRELAHLLVPRLADLAAVDVLDAASVPPQGRLPLRLRRVALAAIPALSRAAEYFGAAGEVLSPPQSAAVARSLAEQRPVVDELPADADAVHELSLHSMIVVPLTARREIVGAITLMRAGSSPPFGQEDVYLAADLARRAATNINNARRYAHEHQTALALQQALLTEPRPPHADVECAARYLPTGTDIEIGGDWYDTVALPGGKTLLVVGDVMGHGFEAAAAMSEYRSLLRTLALQSDRPEAILSEAQRIVDALGFERVATCIVAVLDPVARTCSFASAGHMPPLLVRPDGTRVLLETPGDPPLGVCGSYGYTGRAVPFDPGSVLLCYTDGLVERRGEDIEDCLARLVNVALDPAEPLARLIDALLYRFDPAMSDDDVAVLAARLLPTAPAGPGQPSR
jgi:PAS domain S-box-containing protein